MIKIPTNSKDFTQTNRSDQDGNIWYTKNINFDEKGYIKLSSRAVSLVSDDTTNGGNANFGYPYSIGRRTLNGDFYIVTSDYVLTLGMASTGITISNDGLGATIPVGSVNNRGTWWLNKFHVTTNTSMKSKDGVTGTWASTGVTLTAGYPHPLEVFRNKLQLAVGDKNTVQLFTTGYAAGTATLTLPIDYNVTGLAYQNQKMAVATQLDTSVSGQYQDAFLFVWDGATVSANAGYGVGSDAIIQVVAYKSSWALLTRNGKLLYFNGGGFETLATFPFFFKKYYVDAASMIGDIMTVSGDLIYLNIPADITYTGIKQERFLQNFNGGILCYDPSIGVYHRYSSSMSHLYPVQSGSASINATTDLITATSGTLPETGNPVMYTSDISNQIGGLVVGTVYYMIRVSPTTFRLATTRSNAVNGIYIDLTSTGAAGATFLALDLVDYGTDKTIITNAVGFVGAKNFMYDHLIFGGYASDFATTSLFKYLNVTIPNFSNRGYFVTPSLNSNSVEDNIIKFTTKYKPLNTNDQIIIKAKAGDVIGLPVTTEQRGITCTWTSSTVFTTTANLSEVSTYLSDSTKECEVEIMNGAGAGQMAQISTISLNSGTYTITLAEEIEGAASGRKCGVIIDNWKKLDTITSADTLGYKETTYNIPSKWTKFKFELRGVETTIEEVQFNNQTQLA